MSKEFEELVLKELKELKKDNGMIFKQLKEQEKDLKEFRKETKKRFDETDRRFGEMDKRFNSLERTVTIIEYEVKNNIPALFNANLTRQQKEDSLQSEVDHLRWCISKSFNKNFSSRD